jgi:hypothetical protein
MQLDQAYARLTLSERVRANQMAIFPVLGGWVVMALLPKDLLGDFKFGANLWNNLGFIQPAMAQSGAGTGQETFHLVAAYLAIGLLAVGFIFSLYAIFIARNSTQTMRDFAKIFFGFFVGVATRFTG